jgi:hypothetical protein
MKYMRTIKTDKLINQYEQICWALGYWQRRLELSTSLEQTKYCQAGLDRNEQSLPGWLEVMSLIGMSISDRAETRQLQLQLGVEEANEEVKWKRISQANA